MVNLGDYRRAHSHARSLHAYRPGAVARRMLSSWCVAGSARPILYFLRVKSNMWLNWHFPSPPLLSSHPLSLLTCCLPVRWDTTKDEQQTRMHCCAKEIKWIIKPDSENAGNLIIKGLRFLTNAGCHCCQICLQGMAYRSGTHNGPGCRPRRYWIRSRFLRSTCVDARDYTQIMTTGKTWHLPLAYTITMVNKMHRKTWTKENKRILVPAFHQICSLQKNHPFVHGRHAPRNSLLVTFLTHILVQTFLDSCWSRTTLAASSQRMMERGF